MNRRAQIAWVLKRLLQGASLTQMEAAELANIWRLGAIVFNLRKKGVAIDSLREKNQGHGFHARYFINPDSLPAMREIFGTK